MTKTRLHLTCRRCGHTWLRRSLDRMPKNCASRACNSPYWMKARRSRVAK